jgi:hypothetical protein
MAGDDSASTESGVAVVIDVLLNDADPDGALVPGTVAITGQGQKGEAVANPTAR